MARFEDADAVIDGIVLFDYQKDYSGGSTTSSSIDLARYELPQAAALRIHTRNGTAGDAVSIDLQDSADDSTFADAKTDISDLDDASDDLTVLLDLDDYRRYIQLDYASGDQTVGSSIDVIAEIVFVGSKNSQAL